MSRDTVTRWAGIPGLVFQCESIVTHFSTSERLGTHPMYILVTVMLDCWNSIKACDKTLIVHLYLTNEKKTPNQIHLKRAQKTHREIRRLIIIPPEKKVGGI